MEANRTIFISYRRDVGSFIARAIFSDLKKHGYDVFLDVESINSGQFAPIILSQIKAHAHFLVILTFGTLDRCHDPEDWVRREIETAMDNGRNIIPLLIEGYSFKDAEPFLVGKLAALQSFNALEVPHTFFEEAMKRLRDRYLKLSKPIEITPITTAEFEAIQEKIDEVSKQPEPSKDELRSEALLIEAMRYLQAEQVEKSLELIEHSIQANPKYHKAHYNRGIIYKNQENYDKALAEYNRALYLEPQYTKAYVNRGVVYSLLENYETALGDFNIALEQNPEYSLALLNRSMAYKALLRLEEADSDLEHYLSLESEKTPIESTPDIINESDEVANLDSMFEDEDPTVLPDNIDFEDDDATVLPELNFEDDEPTVLPDWDFFDGINDYINDED